MVCSNKPDIHLSELTNNPVYDSIKSKGGPLKLSFTNYGDAYLRAFEKKCKSVTFIVTHQCSLRCTYCYENHKEDKHMSLDIGKRCVDFLFEEDLKNSKFINSEDCNGILIDFIGGEPLLEVKLIDSIMDYFLHKAIQLNHRWKTQFAISMSTNGVDLMKPDCLNFIQKWKNKLSINVTIDGNKELHDKCRLFPNGDPSYDIAIKSALYCREIFGDSPTKITLSPDNISYTFEAVKDIIQTLHPSYLHGNPCFEKGWEIEHSTIYYNELKKIADWSIQNRIYENCYITFFDTFLGTPLPDTETKNWCGGTGDMLAFDIDGNIYPCLRYSPVSIPKHLSEPMIIGDIYNGFLKKECQRKCITCLESITRQSQSTQECLECPIASGCSWCSAYNYEVFGTPNKRATFICDLHKARCLANNYYWNMLAKSLNIKERLPLNVTKDMALPIIPESEYRMLDTLSK